MQTIIEASTISIALGYPFQLTKTEQSNAQALYDFPLNNLHFYCETLDLTRPFPSTHNIRDYSHEFCWNDFLMREFKRIGLEECCCVLLQGLAIGKQVVAKDEKGLSSKSHSSVNNNIFIVFVFFHFMIYRSQHLSRH